MGDLEDGLVPLKPEKSTAQANVALFLSLYLLLLAFFILLNAISSFEDVKSQKVMDSLSSTFTSLVSVQDGARFTGQLGDVVATREFMVDAQGVFEAAIPAAKVDIIEPGELMQVDMRSDALFLIDSAKIRPAHTDLFDRLVSALSNAPEGVRYIMEFQIGSDYATGTNMPIGETLSVARAGAFAREAMSRGVPPDLVLVGIKHGDPDQLRIRFRIVYDDATQLNFGGGADGP